MLLSAFSASVLAEDRPAVFGFTVEADVDGLFSPVLKSITVTTVAPDLPAAKAGIAPKDRIVEVDGHPVAGAKADELRPLLKKQVGQPLHLRLRHPDGEVYGATLVGAAKPDH